MTTVLLNGRRLPHGDWEGDDWATGANFKTCTDTSTGRDLCYASNGRINLDGKQIRAAVRPRDKDGITLPQAKQAVESLTNTTLIIPPDWQWTQLLAHLRAKKGAVVQGWYSKIPSEYRFQTASNFGHAYFISHYSPTAGMRVWDALDRNTTHHGQWIPARHIRAFMEELSRRNGTTSLYVGYVPLQHL